MLVSLEAPLPVVSTLYLYSPVRLFQVIFTVFLSLSLFALLQNICFHGIFDLCFVFYFFPRLVVQYVCKYVQKAEHLLPSIASFPLLKVQSNWTWLWFSHYLIFRVNFLLVQWQSEMWFDIAVPASFFFFFCSFNAIYVCLLQLSEKQEMIHIAADSYRNSLTSTLINLPAEN